MLSVLKAIGSFIVDHPIWFVLILIGIFITAKSSIRLMRRIYAYKLNKSRIFLRITMPRRDSAKDKDKETEKDFREKIAIMAQFFRNLEETSEMNLWNIIKTRIFKHNVFSFN